MMNRKSWMTLSMNQPRAIVLLWLSLGTSFQCAWMTWSPPEEALHVAKMRAEIPVVICPKLEKPNSMRRME
jgi:hypothetical protein